MDDKTLDDEKLIKDIVRDAEESHPIKKEPKGIYYDFNNTLTENQKYSDPQYQRQA
jgi:hypothetical protein